MQVVNRTNSSVETAASLERELPEFGTLQEFFIWGSSQQPPVIPVETVALDEYTHDVIVSLRKGLVIVLGST